MAYKKEDETFMNSNGHCLIYSFQPRFLQCPNFRLEDSTCGVPLFKAPVNRCHIFSQWVTVGAWILGTSWNHGTFFGLARYCVFSIQ